MAGAEPSVRPGYLASNVGAMDAAHAGPVLYAGFWRRFAAAFLDGIIVYVISFVIGAILGVGLAIANVGDNTLRAISYVVGFLIGVLYYPTQESSEAQATFGKRALGIKVTDLHGQRISFMRALARTLGKWLSTLTLLIGYLMVAWTDRKQALHDMLAGTLVVRSGSG
ncbi:MAG TPA: RDD family protein [Chloroflexota bacterium]